MVDVVYMKAFKSQAALIRWYYDFIKTVTKVTCNSFQITTQSQDEHMAIICLIRRHSADCKGKHGFYSPTENFVSYLTGCNTLYKMVTDIRCNNLLRTFIFESNDQAEQHYLATTFCAWHSIS